jgi:hypothetical protein
VKNRKNDRSDASLQVDHLGDVHGSRFGARPPIREAISKKCIHITWIGFPGRWQKHTVRCVFFNKNNIQSTGKKIKNICLPLYLSTHVGMIRLRFASDGHVDQLGCSDTCPSPSQGGCPATLPPRGDGERKGWAL